MKNRFPLFKDGRILKKEGLCDIRDNTYRSTQLFYLDYTDGILQGCRVRTEDGCLVIGKGMMKYHGFIYMLAEEARIPYLAENRWISLKIVFHGKEEYPDYEEYGMEFCLDSDLARKENELELCRFFLREGFVLQDTYKSFSDMSTEYDTINLIYSTVAGKEFRIIHPEILMNFAEELWDEKKDMADICFCNEIWREEGRVSRRILAAYLSEKGEPARLQEIREFDNERIYRKLEQILKNSGGIRSRNNKAKLIIVD